MALWLSCSFGHLWREEVDWGYESQSTCSSLHRCYPATDILDHLWREEVDWVIPVRFFFHRCFPATSLQNFMDLSHSSNLQGLWHCALFRSPVAFQSMSPETHDINGFHGFLDSLTQLVTRQSMRQARCHRFGALLRCFCQQLTWADTSRSRTQRHTACRILIPRIKIRQAVCLWVRLRGVFAQLSWGGTLLNTQ